MKHPATTTHLAVIPSLDELAADPSRTRELPPATLQALLCRCASVQTTLLGALAAASGRPGEPRGRHDDADRLLGVAEVAERIGMSASWVEKHAADLPDRRSVAGNPRWLKSDIDRWIKNRPVYGKPGKKALDSSIRTY